jgi:hypothetical protein
MESLKRQSFVLFFSGLGLLGFPTIACQLPLPQPQELRQEKEPEGSFSMDFRPERKAGLLILFDGANLDGWSIVGKNEYWKIEDNILRSESGGDGSWIKFNEPLSDFVLMLDWRSSENSRGGVLIRAEDQGLPSETGYQVQLSSSTFDNWQSTCSIYGYLSSPQPPETPANTWHNLEVRALGPRISVSINGAQCMDVDQTSVATLRNKPRRGYIGLRNSYPTKGHHIEFRNIRLELLKP